MASLPSAYITGWREVGGAVFVKDRLIVAGSATQTPRLQGKVQFTFFEAAAVSATLTPNRSRFVSATFSNQVIVRSSVAPMPQSRIASDANGFVFVPGGLTPSPVIWCCVANKEVVLVRPEGTPTAPVPTAAGIDGERVRALVRTGDATAVLRSWSPQKLDDPDYPDPTATTADVAASPRGGTSAIGAGVIAWSDNPAAGALSVGIPGDTGVSDVRVIPPTGPILDVKADAGAVVVTRRVGAGHEVSRVDTQGVVTRIWSGAARPMVAVGGGTVAIVAGRTVLAARGGAPARRAAVANGLVVGVAADGDRLAWLQRRQVTVARQKVRRTVARIVSVPR